MKKNVKMKTEEEIRQEKNESEAFMCGREGEMDPKRFAYWRGYLDALKWVLEENGK